ncbi:MAG: acyl-CoA/acyl-ACP dehydrogenase [Thermoplasmata archaeon]|nr:acyl-CoA/acyl-ACP dehydrogenase [Thermoplasmata archaeon]
MEDWFFTEEQRMFRESLREYLQNHITPEKVVEMEEKREIPRSIHDAMADFELFCPLVSEEYGGAGFDLVTAGIVGEELARVDPTGSTCVYYLVPASWSRMIYLYGTEEAKQELLPKMTKGRMFCGIASTEADTGSDLGNMITTIKPIRNGYVVNGAKNYISGIREARNTDGGHVTLARQDLAAGVRGCTLFFLPLNSKGIEISLDREMGREGMSTGGFHIDNVEIPERYLIGEEKRGFYIIHEGYEAARGIIACVCAGAALKALENAVAYMKERKAFGQPLARYQGMQFPLAEHWSRMMMLRDWAYKALRIMDQEKQGKASRMESSQAIAMAKLWGPLWAFDAINFAMQVQGAYGYSLECTEQKALRAIRSFGWAEGTSEVMRLIIAREVLGGTSWKGY